MHPFIRRKTGEEKVTYLHPKLEPVLERTLGVPLFQEQLMQMAVAVGDCTPEDADLLRRLTFQRFDVAGQPAGPHEFVLRQFAAPDVDAVLGTGFFSTHVVCLDPSRGRVAFR